MEVVFQIIIQPIYSIIEAIFSFLYTHSYIDLVYIIFVLSLIINILCLPFYIKAEKIQKFEKEIQKKLSPKINSIKKNFKGDEKYMLLQTYYRQNNYHPLMFLRMCIPLLIQVPFFFGAYLFFNRLELLLEEEWFFIRDLARPDSLLSFDNVTINVLPIVMTMISIICGVCFVKDKTFYEKLQAYILPLIFLLILYNCSSALVLYWIFNNIFYLVKNIAIEYEREKEFIKYSLILLSVLLLAILTPHLKDVFIVLSLFGFLIYLANKITLKFQFKLDNLTYYLILANYFVLYAFFVPISLISSSPSEFCLGSYPFEIILPCILLCFGLFFFWGKVVFILCCEENRRKILFVLFNLLVLSIYNIFFFSLNSSDISSELTLKTGSLYNEKFILVHFVFYILFFTINYFIFLKNKIKSLNLILSIFLISFSIYSFHKFDLSYKMIEFTDSQSDFVVKKDSKFEEVFKNKPYNLSKNKKNVVVIILDRAIGPFLPYIFKEFPDLKQKYDGFIYYPNTLSFSDHTVLAYPALVGGYDYSILNLHKDNKKLMVQKHNEALLTLPLIFKNNNWISTVSDSPFGDYKEVTPVDLFKRHGIKYYNIQNSFKDIYLNEEYDISNYNKSFAKRNLFYYSLMIASFYPLRDFIYDEGCYLNSSKLSKLDTFLSDDLINSYAQLHYLPSLFDFSSNNNNFILINNNLTHNPSFLSLPNYTLNGEIKPHESIAKGYLTNTHYDVNVASLLMIGDFLEYLKKNNVYNNSRIIIIADHGMFGIEMPNATLFQMNNAIKNNPLFLFKDFDSKGELKTDKKFMTNADMPVFALRDIIKNPINPHSGKIISSNEKEDGVFVFNTFNYKPVFYADLYSPIKNDDIIYHVQGDIYNKKNWKMRYGLD